MTLQQLLYVVTIADEKSMNKAASKLFISQPALSSTIQALEEEMNVQIFMRSNKGITVTTDGEQFLAYARQMLELQQMMEGRFGDSRAGKKMFSVSMQHYSFAVEAFINLTKQYNMDDYEFAVHETKTREVIVNVRDGRSEIGVLYENDFNQRAINKILSENGLEFIPLFDCSISVFLSEEHPLASKDRITFEELQDYPCLTFEQGDNNSFYYAEEVFSTYEYRQTIRTDDRATMLNLIVGVNGYTLCSGIICNDLNRGGYTAVPLDTEDKMTIGYIKRKKMPLSSIGTKYIELLKGYEGNDVQ